MSRALPENPEERGTAKWGWLCGQQLPRAALGGGTAMRGAQRAKGLGSQRVCRGQSGTRREEGKARPR